MNKYYMFLIFLFSSLFAGNNTQNGDWEFAKEQIIKRCLRVFLKEISEICEETNTGEPKTLILEIDDSAMLYLYMNKNSNELKILYIKLQ